MRLEYEPILKQMQRLVLTMESRQSLAILQMPFIELQAYISQQLQDYCLLEQQDDLENENAREESPEDQFSVETGSTKEKYEKSWEEYLSDLSQTDENDGTFEEKRREISIGEEITLQDHLLFQLHLASKTPRDQLIGTFLIGNIDDDGYLRFEVEEAAKTLNVDSEAILGLLNIVQTFEPPGVGARNLKECLLLQLKTQADFYHDSTTAQLYSLTVAIIENHLNDLAEGKLSKISIKLKSPVQDIQKALEIIRRLDPKPGKNFGSLTNFTNIMPDVIVKKVGPDYAVIVNETPTVKLKINSFYRRIIAGEEKADQETVNFLKGKLNSALWLIKCIEHRRMTLYKITEAIVELQRGFFEKGPQDLKPLTLREVAEKVGLHESTVSRATAGKYMETPKGIFSLKYFFNARLDTLSGEAMSSVSVKKLIKEIIDRENSKSPYSDQKIAEILLNKGIMISRRTVAKYREEMMIPPSSRRRRY